MRNVGALFSVVAFLTTASHVQAQAVSSTGEDCSQNGMACRYWLPEGYDSNQRYPLVIYLHGAGQRGSDNKGHVDDWADLLHALLSPENRLKFPAFVMAPQCPGSNEAKWVDWPWEDGSYDITQVAESVALAETRSMLTALQGKHSVDPDRLYVMGFSMGGFGTWDMISRTPELFAAGAPSDGGGSPQAAAKLQNMAVWSFHNADDGSVPVSSDREMFAALAAAGSRPTYTEGARGGHGAHGRAAGDPAFFSWLFAQRRGVPATPSERLAFAPGGGHFEVPTTLVLSSEPADAPTRYTLDLTLPSSVSGALYSTPIKIEQSAIITAVSTLIDDDTGAVNVFHAAPFQIGDRALPGDAALKPSLPQVSDSSGSSGARSSDTSMPTVPGSGGAGQPLGSDAAGARSAADATVRGSGTGGGACSIGSDAPGRVSGGGGSALLVLLVAFGRRCSASPVSRRRPHFHQACL